MPNVLQAATTMTEVRGRDSTPSRVLVFTGAAANSVFNDVFAGCHITQPRGPRPPLDTRDGRCKPVLYPRRTPISLFQQMLAGGKDTGTEGRRKVREHSHVAGLEPPGGVGISTQTGEGGGLFWVIPRRCSSLRLLLGRLQRRGARWHLPHKLMMTLQGSLVR